LVHDLVGTKVPIEGDAVPTGQTLTANSNAARRLGAALIASAAIALAMSLSPQAVGEALGATTATVPASTPVTVSTLQQGSATELLPPLEEIVKPVEEVVGPVKEKVEETIEPVKEKVEGAVGGAPTGGSGGGSTGGSTTITSVTGVPGAATIVLAPAPGASAPAGAAPSAPASGRLKLLSRRVKGRVATLVLAVPSSGRLSIAGSGARSVARELSRSQRVTVRVALTKARAAWLRRHPRSKVVVALHASFAPVSGARSAVATRVSLR
jgi:hypothetical protein